MKIQSEDVFGKENEESDHGMVVAIGYPPIGTWFSKEEYNKLIKEVPDVCPVWGDHMQWRSVTVICKEEDEVDVQCLLAMTHGGGINRYKKLTDGRIALRSDYQAW